MLTVLELANEMIERGFEFGMIDLYKSDAENFVIEGNKLIAPFRAVPSLGTNVANKSLKHEKTHHSYLKKILPIEEKFQKP